MWFITKKTWSKFLSYDILLAKDDWSFIQWSLSLVRYYLQVLFILFLIPNIRTSDTTLYPHSPVCRVYKHLHSDRGSNRELWNEYDSSSLLPPHGSHYCVRRLVLPLQWRVVWSSRWQLRARDHVRSHNLQLVVLVCGEISTWLTFRNKVVRTPKLWFNIFSVVQYSRHFLTKGWM